MPLSDQDNLTPEEKEKYKMRMLEEVPLKIRKMAAAGDFETKDTMFKRAMQVSMANQAPMVTDAMLQSVLSDETSSWQPASGDDDQGKMLKDFSTLDGKNICGEREDDDSLAASLAESSRRFAANVTDVPDSFRAGREKWQSCNSVFSHVRNQGQCGSCWANAVAGVVEGQACILSGGRFSGEAGWISAGYVTSCETQYGAGCQGGWTAGALRWAGENGIPTGGEGSSTRTCQPYFGTGNALKHFTGPPNKAPACPETCAPFNNYGRPLAD